MSQLQLKTFRITDQASEDALNAFLRGKKAYHWSVSYADNGWNILMIYEQERQQQNRRANHAPQERHEQSSPKRNHENSGAEYFVPDIPAEQVPLYDAIRRWRNNNAREANVKPYEFFNNKQLEAIIKAKPADPETLKPMLPDMKPEHFEKYAGELIGMVNAT